MGMKVSGVVKIAKEEIVRCRFKAEEVLKDYVSLRERKSNLFRAMILGNAYHFSCRIEFESDQGMCSVETPVWELTNNYVIFQNGTTMPIGSIHRVFV